MESNKDNQKSTKEQVDKKDKSKKADDALAEEDLVSYMIDDAPAKTGFFTPGSHLEIFPSSILLGKDAPDYVLVFAWSFFDEILKRNESYIKDGGRMILPLPKVKVFPEKKYNE